jgi:DDE family transposase
MHLGRKAAPITPCVKTCGVIRNPEKMRQRRETVEHPFGMIKARMGATHFLMKTLPRVATEMALHVLAYNLTRVMNIMGPGRLIAEMRT